MTKEQQFKQEDRAMDRAMDAYYESKTELLRQHNILIAAMREIAVPYPENNNPDSAEILCKYLIARAQEAISKTQKNKDL